MGILHNELMRVYDMRPSTAEYVMDITEWIDRIAKLEYAQGRIDEALDEKWIPLSETSDLPESEVLACDKYGNMMFGFLSGSDGEYVCDSDEMIMCDVVAWRKKPRPYRTENDSLLNTDYVVDEKSYRKGERDMFDLITSAEYGKQCYFDQDNGSIYSRKTGRYLSNLDEALDDWLGEV